MTVDHSPQRRADRLRQAVEDYCRTSPHNSLGNASGEPAWERPLVGFARGDDPFFARLKEQIGSFFWTPLEAFNQVHAGLGAQAGELTVICYVLPQTRATRLEQRAESVLPGERWCRSRFRGENFNIALRNHLVDLLGREGVAAVAPERSPDFAYRSSERFGIASNWSERHAAFVAGLGTFGLSDGLITAAGKAMRCGSVVARLDLPATPRPYSGHQDYCLFYARGTCGACIGRCPVGAIDTCGHDKERCRDYIRDVTARHARQTFGIDATPCGLCQVAIPCEDRNPLA